MSSRSSNSSMGDFEQISTNELDTSTGSTECEELAASMDDLEIQDEVAEENIHLRSQISNLHNRISEQDARLIEFSVDNDKLKYEIQKLTVSEQTLNSELEVANMKLDELEREKKRLETTGYQETPTETVKMADFVNFCNLMAQEIQTRDTKIEEMEAEIVEQRKQIIEITFNPVKTPKKLKEELKLADQQIGIIVDHNDYLRTVEANEHTKELAALRKENEELNMTIDFLKKQML